MAKRTRKAAAIIDNYPFMRVLVELEGKQALSKDDIAWVESALVELERAHTWLSVTRVRVSTLLEYPHVQRRAKPEKPLTEQIKDVLVAGEHSMKSDLI